MTANNPHNTSYEKKFIESDNFPISLVSLASGKEKMIGARPPYWEMIFWWTRKPLSSARAIIAGSLLPERTNQKEFVDALMLDGKHITHKYNPIIPLEWIPLFQGKNLLDPFAGFGSIPLEGLRLGLDVTSIELLPTPHIFLKSVLEYPSKYRQQILYDIKKWGKWVTEQLKQDKTISELYDNTVSSYICSWEILCPHCNRVTPLIGNFWLIKAENAKKLQKDRNLNLKSNKAQFKRLTWFSINHHKEKDDYSVNITDLQKENTNMNDLMVIDNKIKRSNEVLFTVPKPNVSARFKEATCLRCGTLIKYIDPNTGKHYLEKKSVLPEIKNRLEWYVKYAIRKYHQGNTSIASHRLFVKVKNVNGHMEFYKCDKVDQIRFKQSENKLKFMLSSIDPDIPVEDISPYSGRYILPLEYGIKQWYQLFNPRQLIVLLVLVKLIREVSVLVEKEKRMEWQDKARSTGYAEAIVVYLSLALCSLAEYKISKKTIATVCI